MEIPSGIPWGLGDGEWGIIEGKGVGNPQRDPLEDTLGDPPGGSLLTGFAWGIP